MTNNPNTRPGPGLRDAAANPRPEDQVEQVGSRLRDAAVDPSAADLLPPTNAGDPGPVGNPHGSGVVAIEVDDPRRIEAVRQARVSAGDVLDEPLPGSDIEPVPGLIGSPVTEVEQDGAA